MTPLFRPLPGRRLPTALRPTALWWCLWFAAASIAAPGPARADDVDLALVLAVDVSSSIDSERYELQRRGYAEAFRSPEIMEAIRNGTRGAIAVTLMEWAGPGEQRSVIDWTVLHDEASARRFGSALAEAPRVTSGLTAIGDAVAAATARLDSCEHRADRRVIDVSGDGASNAGRRTDTARDGAVAAGITINGLPIRSNEPDVEEFYRQNVIGGQGAFLIVAQGFDSFAGAILDKLLREIAATPPSDAWSRL